MCILPGKDLLVVTDKQQNKIIYYGYDGSFVKEFSFPGSPGAICVIDQSKIAIHTGRKVKDSNHKINHELTVIDLDGGVISQHFPFESPLSFTFGLPFTRPNRDGSVFYSKQFDFNLYKLDGKAEPVANLLLDYGNLMVSLEDLNGPSIEDLAVIQQQGKRSVIDRLYNCYDHLALLNMEERKASLILIDKRIHNIMTFGTDSLKNIGYVDGFPIPTPLDTYQEYFLSLIEAVDLVQYINQLSKSQMTDISRRIKGLDLLKNLKDEDNPVLVFYKFKNF